MKNLLRFGPLALALAGLVACGKSSAPAGDSPGTQGANTAPSFVASCNKANKTSKCDEYASTTLSLEEDMCKEIGGTYSTTAACPTENRLGTCKKASGTTYYYQTNLDLNYTAQTAKEDCEDELTHGKWTPAPGGAPAGKPAQAAQNTPAKATTAPPGDAKKPAPAPAKKPH